MIDPNTVQDEELRQHSLREQERDRQQAILDMHVEMKKAREAAERAYWQLPTTSPRLL